MSFCYPFYPHTYVSNRCNNKQTSQFDSKLLNNFYKCICGDVGQSFNNLTNGNVEPPEYSKVRKQIVTVFYPRLNGVKMVKNTK